MPENNINPSETPTGPAAPPPIEERIGRIILWIRWLQLPLLLGLGLALVVFITSFFTSLGMAFNGNDLRGTGAILLVLDLIDMVLIANLIVMVLVSGYKIFVARVSYDWDRYMPAWLSGLTLSGVKTRISATVLLISTIHLLHELLDPSVDTVESALLILAAQLIFILTTLTFALIERWE